MKSLQWDLMPAEWKYRVLVQFDFSDLPGSRAEWVNTPWGQLPREMRRVLKQMK